MKIEKIGLVGVGLMGHGIAKNILKKGWKLSFLDHVGNQPVDDLLELGGVGKVSIDQIGSISDVVIVCVSGTPQVEQVLQDEGGLFASMKSGSVVIDCSTSLPDSTKWLAETAKQKGIGFLDAPMTRTSKEAEDGKLNLLVGGDADLFEKCKPLLQAFAENIIHTGDVSTGHALKLVHNFVSLGFSTILSEAAVSANKAGIDPNILVDVLAKGGGSSVVLDRFIPQILNGDPSGMEFSIANAAKDLDYYCQMNLRLNQKAPCAQTVKSVTTDAVEQGYGESYIPSLVKILCKLNDEC